MKSLLFGWWMRMPVLLAFAFFIPHLNAAQTEPVTMTVAPDTGGPALSDDFLGLSYETSILLPVNGNYYFGPFNQALLNTFKTLGIKSLRVGGNSVDDPHIAVPDIQDIELLFEFARAANVKVIYSFRLKNGDPVATPRLAKFIEAHYADVLDAFAIGNEPSFYLKTFPDYYWQWRPYYDAILQSIANPKFDGPSVSRDDEYTIDFANAVSPGEHLTMASNHYYFLGSGREGEKNPAKTRARFLQNHLDADYQKKYDKVGAVLAAKGIPYRIDEMNSCYDGGAKGSSDTYASTLWALDCTHWWAAHHILGVNYHTGESVGRDGVFGAANYAAFVHATNGVGFVMRPQAYAYLAFTQGAHGRPLGVSINVAANFNFNAYAYHDNDGSYYLTLINKSYGTNARPASVSIQLQQNTEQGTWQRMDVVQKNQDVAAKADVMLGGAMVDTDGLWHGKWKKVRHASPASLTVVVAPASAAILHLVPKK
jgi:hypothetical protein